MSSTSPSALPASPSPRLIEIYLAFQTCALHAFGGVLPFVRRELVERRHWLSSDEFTEILGLCQFLPGPNISNLAIAIGSRFRGIPGALAAFAGLYFLPIVIVLGLANLYARYGTLPAMQGALSGIASVAAGLIFAMGLKMARPLFKERRVLAIGFIGLTFVAIGLLRLPLLWVLPLLAVLSTLCAGERK